MICKYSDCSGLTSVDIPNSVTSIGVAAFEGCSGLTSVTMPNDIVSIERAAFPGTAKLYVKKGSKTLLTLWNWNKSVGSQSYYDNDYKYIPYDKDTDKEILPTSFTIAPTTQTTASVKIENIYEGYTYIFNGKETSESEFSYTKVAPATTTYLNLLVQKGDVQYEVSGSFKTKGVSPQIEAQTLTASSIIAMGTYTEGDAKVVSEKIQITNDDEKKGNQYVFSGLNAGRSYTVRYAVEVDYGGEETSWYYARSSISTAPLRFCMAQPKVVSEGNVILSASANLDDNETNVGFEWRCIDWTDEFPSNTGTAYLYNGTMEGYIKNMNTSKLWKCRPYYLSDSGTYHYGDWMGVDLTNTSYFEPTVHTYAKISIEGNTALVRGYALSGTDDVVVRGFKYWRTGPNTYGQKKTRAASLPADVITVEATGQQAMSANLTGLTYNSIYHYVAFATTSAGETFYGEEQSFATPLAVAKYATFYDSESAYTLPAGLTASVVTGVSGGKLVYKVIAEGGKSNNVLPKGVAVMLTSAKNDATAYTLTPTESETTYTGTNWLHGSDEATTTTASGGNRYYKLSYGHSDTDKSEVFGWYWGATNGGAFQIEGHKAWLAVPTSAGAPIRAFSMEGDATDIESVYEPQTTMPDVDDAWYDLSGRKLDGKPTTKGIYIHKGKKIIIK